MRQWSDVTDLRPLLIGTLVDNGGTAVGNSVDTHGFADVLAIIQWAVVGGTADAQAQLTVKFQEGGAAASTGGDMTDIDQGWVTGTFTMTTAYGTAPTYPYLASTCIYERLSAKKDGTTMARYIRPIASLAGTSGVLFVYSVSVLLGRPYDSALLQKGMIFTSNAAEFKLPEWEGA